MVNVIIFISFALSGVYFWSSGIPQISHILLVFLSFILFFKTKKIYSASENKYLYGFVFYAATVNLLYYLIYYDLQFIASSVQIVFNLVIFVSVTSILIYYKNALDYVVYGVVVGVIIQWVVYFFGLGNYSLAPRYAGTFNDPNQMAYWLIASFSIFWIARRKFLPSKLLILFMVVSFLFFVILTMSRSAFLAIAFFLIAFLGYKYTKFFILMAVFSIIVSSVSLSTLFITTDNYIEDDVIIDRLLNVDVYKQADERGYTRFIQYPEYVFLGSGQGEHSRFNQLKSPTYLNVEMHTTWGGVLFYYGVIGFTMLMLFLRGIILKADPYNRIILLSTFCYALSTYSFRTPVFWLLLSVLVSTPFVIGKISEENNQ